MNLFSGIVFTLIIMSVIFFSITGNLGLLHLKEIKNEIAVLEGKNRELESDILSTKSNVLALRHSKDFLEKKAREELGLSKPGEVVYFFPEEVPHEQQKKAK